MRVIAGKARRLNLETLPGLDTRPTTDRIKETLFNILQADIPGASFLDLFAGSGAIGIEALSRGAENAVFVDKNPKACACIRRNLEFTRLPGGSVLNINLINYDHLFFRSSRRKIFLDLYMVRHVPSF